MEIIKGDLLDLADQGKFDVIIHGCNCFNIMGAGIAADIARRYPQAYEADKRTIRGDYNKLGTYTKATALTKTQTPYPFTIINAYSQYTCDARQKPDLFEYTAFRLILQKLLKEFPAADFGFPLIGCGLCNGNQDEIVGMIKSFSYDIEWNNGSVTIVVLDGNNRILHQ